MTGFPRSWEDAEISLFRDNVRRFIDAEIVPHDDRFRKQQKVDRELWNKAGELGLLLTDVPSEYGGGGGDYRFEVVIGEELGRACCSSFLPGVHSILAHYILNHGTEEQKQRWLPRMATGELVGAICMTEPGTGSDLQGIRARADKDGDVYRITGSKTFISNGYHANLLGVVCRTEDGLGSGALSILMLEVGPEGAPGYRVGRVLEKMGQKGQDTSELFFDGVEVPQADLLGGVEGKGMAQLMSDLVYERCGLVMLAAAMERALELTTDYVRDRKAFGQSLIEYQNTRFKLAEVKTLCHLARLIADDCISKMIRGELDTTTVSMLKLWITENASRAFDECLQLHGGYGYMDEYPISRWYADIRVSRIYGGTSEIMKEIIARSL